MILPDDWLPNRYPRRVCLDLFGRLFKLAQNTIGWHAVQLRINRPQVRLLTKNNFPAGT
jgi:hypothetical protein